MEKAANKIEALLGKVGVDVQLDGILQGAVTGVGALVGLYILMSLIFDD